DRLRAALPGAVEDVREIGRMADGFVDIALGDADAPGVVQLNRDSVAGKRCEAGRRAKLFDARLELLLCTGLCRRAALDLVQLEAQLREVAFELVLLPLESLRRIDKGGVVADG